MLLRSLPTLAYVPTRNLPLLIALNFVGASIGAFGAPARARPQPQLVGRRRRQRRLGEEGLTLRGPP
jgi:hypothetical protein